MGMCALYAVGAKHREQGCGSEYEEKLKNIWSRKTFVQYILNETGRQYCSDKLERCCVCRWVFEEICRALLYFVR